MNTVAQSTQDKGGRLTGDARPGPEAIFASGTNSFANGRTHATIS